MRKRNKAYILEEHYFNLELCPFCNKEVSIEILGVTLADNSPQCVATGIHHECSKGEHYKEVRMGYATKDLRNMWNSRSVAITGKA